MPNIVAPLTFLYFAALFGICFMIIQQVGRSKVETVAELESLVKERQQVWLVVVKRGNQTVRLQLAG